MFNNRKSFVLFALLITLFALLFVSSVSAGGGLPDAPTPIGDQVRVSIFLDGALFPPMVSTGTWIDMPQSLDGDNMVDLINAGEVFLQIESRGKFIINMSGTNPAIVLNGAGVLTTWCVEVIPQGDSAGYGIRSFSELLNMVSGNHRDQWLASFTGLDTSSNVTRAAARAALNTSFGNADVNYPLDMYGAVSDCATFLSGLEAAPAGGS